MKQGMLRGALDADTFGASKAEITKRYRRAMGGDVWGIATDCDYYLDQSLSPASIKIKKTGEADNMLDVTCFIAGPHFASTALSEVLRRCYQEKLCYDYFEAHSLEISTNAVILSFITLQSAEHGFVTGMIRLIPKPTRAKSRSAKQRSGAG